jgi:anti-sigma factor RsiW
MSVPFRRKLRGVLQKQAPFMITCRQLEDFIGDYLEGELPFRQRFTFRLHLVFCRECRDYLAAYREAVTLGKAAYRPTNEALPDEIPEELVRAILSARGRD